MSDLNGSDCRAYAAHPVTVRPVLPEDIPACMRVIRESFQTVADTFGLTRENAPRFTAFAATEERLLWQLETEKRPMLAACEGTAIVGYCSLMLLPDGQCELNNLAVLPALRHRGIGQTLLLSAAGAAKAQGCCLMHIGIVEENLVLRRWYERFGAVHTGCRKFDFFPFTCGYMELKL